MAGSRLRESAPATLDPLKTSGTTDECVFCVGAGWSPLKMVVDVPDENNPAGGWWECRLGADDDDGPAWVGWGLFASRCACCRCAWWDGWFGFAHGVCSMNCSPAVPRLCSKESPAAVE